MSWKANLACQLSLFLSNQPCRYPESSTDSSKERQFMLQSQKILDSPFSEAHLPQTYSSLSCFLSGSSNFSKCSSIAAERSSGLSKFSACLHSLNSPKQPHSVRGTIQVIHSQLNAYSLAPGNGPKYRLHPQTYHSRRTSASSRRTHPRNISISKAFSMSSQILTHPKEMNNHA